MSVMEIVIETLKKGTNQDPTVFKPAESQLKSWEHETGFFPMLAKITSDLTIEHNVRWLASMYLKNGVDRYWREIVKNSLTEEEKNEIRLCLLQNDSEPYPQIAVQLSNLIARLARLDFPKEWPELLQTLYERTKTNDCLVQERALNTLYRTVCQLASKRLPNDRRAFQELTTHLFEYMLHLWNNLTDVLFSTDVRSNDFPSVFERSRLCAKILRKLVIHGFNKPCLHPEVNVYIENTFLRVKSLMELRKAHEELECITERIEHYVILLTKTMIDLLEHHPFSFIQFIRPSIDLTLFYVFNPAGEAFLFPRFVIQCFNIMKCIIACPEFRASMSAASDLPETKNAVEIKKELFTPEICVGVCNKLMSKYFLLSTEELELWERDPEAFWSESEATESSKYNLRPAIINLFTGLFRENQKVLIPFLSKVVDDTKNIVGADDIHAIRQKDAIYNMVGIGASEFFDVINFDDWFQKILIQELNIKNPNYRILRRRVILLVGQWVTIKFSEQSRQILYEAIIHLLSTDEDIVVRVAAATTLKSAIGDFEFDVKTFLPYMPSLFGLLYELLKEAKQCETKLMVLHVMSFSIEYINIEIKPHVGPLIQYLPLLWVESQDHDMLRCGILSALTSLTVGLMDASDKIHGFLISVTRFATDVNEKSHVYLVEEGLVLWSALVDNCPTNSADSLLNLYENMFALFELGTESIMMCFQITMAYIALCPQPFLSRYGPAIIEALQPFMGEFYRQTEMNVVMAQTYEMILRVLPWEGTQMLKPILPMIIGIITENCEYKYTEIYSMQITIISRVVLADGGVFNSVVTQVASNMKISAEELLEKILNKWWNQIPLISREDKRKLCAMGLADICANNWPPVIKVWGHAMTSITEVIFDITGDDNVEDTVVYSREYISAEPYYTENEHRQRMKQICIRDPAHSMPLRQFLAVRLKAFEQNVGSAVVGELFETLEEDCKTLLREVTAT